MVKWFNWARAPNNALRGFTQEHDAQFPTMENKAIEALNLPALNEEIKSLLIIAGYVGNALLFQQACENAERMLWARLPKRCAPLEDCAWHVAVWWEERREVSPVFLPSTGWATGKSTGTQPQVQIIREANWEILLSTDRVGLNNLIRTKILEACGAGRASPRYLALKRAVAQLSGQ